jgi:hypothetical protein
MREGLWSVEYVAADGWEHGGVFVLENQRLSGGGERYYCVGEYHVAKRTFTAEARFAHFHGPTRNAFGASAPFFRLVLKGRIIADDLIEGEAHESDHAGPKLPFRCVWRA